MVDELEKVVASLKKLSKCVEDYAIWLNNPSFLKEILGREPTEHEQLHFWFNGIYPLLNAHRKGVPFESNDILPIVEELLNSSEEL